MTEKNEKTETTIKTPMDVVAARVMFEMMDQEARDKLMTEALANLLKAKDLGYGSRGNTPLADAFHVAVREHVNAIVREHVKKPENVVKVEALVSKVVANVLDSDSFSDLIKTLIDRAVSKIDWDR